MTRTGRWIFPTRWVALAGFLEPCGDSVLGFEVGRGRVGDCLGRRRPALCQSTALDHPRQDPRPLGFQFVAKLLIALLERGS